MQTLTIQELYQKHSKLSPTELILDVRTPDEYNMGHVPNSKNISHDTVAGHVSELKKYERIYVYCRSGGRVQMACQVLQQMGLQNLFGVVDGGMPDWEQSGYPVGK